MMMIQHLRTLALAMLVGGPALAQSPTIPSFFDPVERFERPDLTLDRMRFLTVTDFAPFSEIDRQNRLVGFHVELARAICDELGVSDVCEIQALPFAELEPALKRGEGEALIAGIAMTPDSTGRLDFTRPYFQLPARFLARADAGLAEPIAEATAGRDIGVIERTAHAAYLRNRFSRSRIRVFQSREQALKALDDGTIAAFFSDGLSLARLLAEPGMATKFAFAGGPYMDTAFFGEGLAIAVARGDELRDGLDWALAEIDRKGIFEELYLRHFPIGLF